jgi:hypothetical protein
VWSRAYSAPPSRITSQPTSKYFHSASVVLHHLSTILLDIDLADLQNAIGKAGGVGITQALANLTDWASKSPLIAKEVAYNAVKTIVSLAPRPNFSCEDDPMTDSAPYSVIALFLCHIVLWIFVRVSPRSQKHQLLEDVARNEALRSSPFFEILRTSLSLDERGASSSGSSSNEASKLLFKSAAETLTQLGTWGASLNLALLLHRRAELQ